MTKKEWYDNYSAARLLLRSADVFVDKDIKTAARKLIGKGIYATSKELHTAVYNYDKDIYDIRRERWSIRHNSTVFNRKKSQRG